MKFDFPNVLLNGTSILLAGIAVSLLGITIHQGFLARFLSEVQTKSSGGLAGVGAAVIRHLGSLNRRIIWPRYETRIGKSLVKAGEPNAFRPEDILALQEVGFIVGTLLGAWVMTTVDRTLVASLAFGFFGAAYPLIWIRDQIKRRHLKILRALPYNLDLLTLSVEAGLDFTAALAKVVEKGKGGPLREEFQLVLKQLKMGTTREEALRALIARVELPALTTIVNSLIQANKMGTSLGKVLRIQSTQLRIERTQRAEKLAGEAPVKMLFPLVACIFPTIFMILFGPVVFAFISGKLM